MICETRGCGQPVALVAGRVAMRSCLGCLTGTRRLARVTSVLDAVAALPPLVVADGFGFRVPGSPMSWNHALVRPRGRGRPYLRKEARDWKSTIAAAALMARPAGWLLQGLFAIEIHSVFARSTSDADGPIKLALDAVQGICFANDRQVAQVTARKSVDPALQRLEMMIRREK